MLPANDAAGTQSTLARNIELKKDLELAQLRLELAQAKAAAESAQWEARLEKEKRQWEEEKNQLLNQIHRTRSANPVCDVSTASTSNAEIVEKEECEARRHAMSEDSKVLPDGVACYTMMNESALYFQHKNPHKLYSGSSQECMVELLPQYLEFAGEMNNALYFYTKHRNSEDGDWEVSFYKAQCNEASGNCTVDFQEISSEKTERTKRFACQQPYFFDSLFGGTSTVKNFEGLSIVRLPPVVMKHINALDFWTFFVKRRIVYIVTYSEDAQEPTSITAHSKNVFIINIQDGHVGFGDHMLTSVYAQENSLIYILSNTTLVVIGENRELVTFEIEYPPTGGKIGGLKNEKLFINAPTLFFGKDLGKEHHELVIGLENLQLQDIANSQTEEDDFEPLPDSMACYSLMNGSTVYFQYEYGCELFLGRISEECSVKNVPSDLKIAGELNNSMYFYTQKRDVSDWTYTFYKLDCGDSEVSSRFNLQMLRSITREKPIKFAHQQPYFVDFYYRSRATVENFEGVPLVKFSQADGKYISRRTDWDFFVRRNIVYFIAWNRSELETTSIAKYSRNIVIINFEDGIGNDTYSFHSQSVYAQANSLMYIMSNKTLLIVRENLEFTTFEMDDYASKAKIGGLRSGRLFLNAPLAYFCFDIGEEHRQLAIEQEKQQIQEDEGFDSAEDNTSDLDDDRLNIEKTSESIVAKIEFLRQTLERLTEEKIAREEERCRLSKSVFDARKSISNGNSVFLSKQVLFSFTDEYDVNEILGMGGGGCVFEAVNKFDEWKYAVKRIAVDPIDSLIEKALREVRAMAQLDHHGIVKYNSTWIERPPEDWQYVTDDEMLRSMKSKKRQLLNYNSNCVFIYIQMQLCNYSLSNWLSEYTSSDSRKLSRMKSWFKQIATAVEYIHEKNIIHRDLKPGNILFVEKDRLKICDLGIATERKIVDGVEITTRRSGSGTEMYMSPEQQSLALKINAKSDVFTLGLILTELCIVFSNFRDGKTNDIFDDERTAVFVESLTQTDSKKRPTARQMLTDVYLL